MALRRLSVALLLLAGDSVVYGSRLAKEEANDDDAEGAAVGGEEELCIVTANIEERETLPQTIGEICGSAGIIVVAQQESSVDLTKKPVAGFTHIGECKHIGFGRYTTVQVLGREELDGFGEVKCSVVDESTGFKRMAKGTAIATVKTPAGTLVAASTHGTYGGVVEAKRVKGFVNSAKKIVKAKPDIVAWAGDFNPRTPIDAAAEQTLLALDDTDQAAEMAYEMLTPFPDHLGDTRSVDEVLHDASNGELQQLDVRHMCPSYRKSDNKAVPRFACKAPGSPVKEYYFSPKDGKTDWRDPKGNRMPSWTERLIVKKSMKESCQPAQKIMAKNDHDIVFVKCAIGSESKESGSKDGKDGKDGKR